MVLLILIQFTVCADIVLHILFAKTKEGKTNWGYFLSLKTLLNLIVLILFDVYFGTFYKTPSVSLSKIIFSTDYLNIHQYALSYQ